MKSKLEELEHEDSATLTAIVERAMNVQRRNPPDSDEWQTASIVIHLVAAILAERQSK